MSTELIGTIIRALREFASDTRLYELSAGAAGEGLLVEAFHADDALHSVGGRDIVLLSTDARIDPLSLLGEAASLRISLADGSRAAFGGHIVQAAKLGGNGGLARYRITLAPWLWLLTRTLNSRAWQDESVIEIVDAVFAAYQPQAAWAWSGEVRAFMAERGTRGYCCQYRESDFDFVSRLLGDEGLTWRFDYRDGQERMVIFADSTLCPEDASSEAGGGIRYHAAGALEHSDAIQSMQLHRSISSGAVTLASYDYKAKRVVTSNVPTNIEQRRPGPEHYDYLGQYAFANAAVARRYAEAAMESIEARSGEMHARSTVRTLRAGTRITVTQAPLRDFAPDFVVTRVRSVGINNLPAKAREGLDALFGPVFDELDDVVGQARKTGYGNCFEAMTAKRPWRPLVHDKSTAQGSQSALVIGDADEVYCDRLGRVRIRFHWQDDEASCWVRVAQRYAGAGIGSQFLPRVGQEVLVQFIEGDIDRPVIVGALYNGQGEGGIVPTPGGRRDRESDPSVFALADDHTPAGQGNVAGGNSPMWHGAATQWGVRSKEFGGRGYNQLVFDDTDGQGRVQLKTTQHASELNLGYLIHSADNYRGSFRGMGAELRTDAYGAVRAGAGLLVSSYAIAHDADARDEAGENTAGSELMEAAAKLAANFTSAAQTHQTVGLASVDASQLNEPIIAVSAKAGLGAVAAQDMQLANGEAISLMSGEDSEFIVGGQMRMHGGRAIGVLAGVGGKGGKGDGLQMIAEKGAVDYQAQFDELKVQARDEVNIVSANSHIDWAAAKRISISTEGGANITIEGGNITVQCPGEITVQAANKKFEPATKVAYPLPSLPNSVCVECLKNSLAAAPAFTKVE